jgi:hypothetical protein
LSNFTYLAAELGIIELLGTRTLIPNKKPPVIAISKPFTISHIFNQTLGVVE